MNYSYEMSFSSYKLVIVFIFVYRYLRPTELSYLNEKPTLETNFQKKEFPRSGDLPVLNRKMFRAPRVVIAEHPYVVSIRRQVSHYLTGTLLTKNLILTVAHPIYKVSPCELAVVVGENYADRGTKLLTVVLLVFHQDFNPYTFVADIALLRIYQDIVYKVTIKPISLSPWIGEAMRNGHTAFVTGWGRCDRMGTELCLPKSSRYYRGEKLDPMLRSIKFTMAPNRHCDEYSAHELKIDDSMLCVGPARVDDVLSPCMAVPGAPLVVDAQLAGMLSWGFGCGYLRDLPLVYTNIEAYLRWLIGHIPILRNITKESLTDLYHATKVSKITKWLHDSRAQYDVPKAMRSDMDMQPLAVDYKLAKLRGEIYDIRDFIENGKFHESKLALYQLIKQQEHRVEAVKEIGLRNRVQGVPFMSEETLKAAGFGVSNGTLSEATDVSSREADEDDEDEEDEENEEVLEARITTLSTAVAESTPSTPLSDSDEDYQNLPVETKTARITLDTD